MATTDPEVVLTVWPDLTAADYTPVKAAGERAVYRAVLRDSSGPQIFLRACRDGELEIVMKLIEHGADVASMDGYQNSALHYASFHGHHEIMKLLLQNHAAPGAQNHVGNSPLHLAVEAGQEEAAAILLMSGTDLLSVTNTMDQTPAQLAVAMGQRRRGMGTFLATYNPP